MADNKAGSGLQTLFAIFLGLMVTSFVGVGVYTFYPPPGNTFRTKIESLSRQEQAIRNSQPDNALTPADRAQMQKIIDERDRIQDASRASSEAWAGRTSIILVALATIVMALSLTAAAQLPVISNGLLMGGVFTMLYGVGWVIASGTSSTRFIVISFALAITLVLGYLRFVRRRASTPANDGNATAPGGDLTALEQRVRTIEERMEKAAAVLSS